MLSKSNLVVSIMLVFIILGIQSVYAASGCPVKPDAKTTAALIAEVPSINTALQSCPTAVPAQMKKLVKNGIFLLQITDNSDIAATIADGNITGVSVVEGGNYAYKVTLTSCQLDNILSKGNPIGAFSAYYLSGKANLGAKGFVNKVKLFFGKFFMKSAFKQAQIAVDDCTANGARPENCYDTYLPGYQEYSDPKVKEIWDARLAETGEVCQTQTSERPKGDCKYLYEQIKNNDKKWVCWY